MNILCRRAKDARRATQRLILNSRPEYPLNKEVEKFEIANQLSNHPSISFLPKEKPK
jgi:hypothetical protein